ncbi:protein translocase subunit SecF [Thermotoga profunda]|uniref:protein translocase subunit SecF n=1 Tax=Thermotoga profunda TaxID=1508420 RepID=UPI000596FB2A|nr:protein translocase subunit SecF [Thermotoga profunda]
MKHFDFVGKRRIFISISVILVALSLVFIFTKGFNFGVEFLGGSELILRVESSNFTEADVRKILSDISTEFSSARVTRVRSVGDPEDIVKFSITLTKTFSAEEKADLQAKIESKVSERNIKGQVVSFNETGGSAAEEVRRLTWRAVIITLVAILVYITLRFNFVFGVGATLALVHDVVVTMGFFSIFSYELNVPAVAAFLTLIGYSLNNTIIVYDRIRENMKKFKGKEISFVVNDSINQVFRRTINTSLTTFFVVFVLLLFAGNAIKPFAFGMTIGTVVGTYSSIYIASPLVIRWVKNR